MIFLQFDCTTGRIANYLLSTTVHLIELSYCEIMGHKVGYKQLNWSETIKSSVCTISSLIYNQSIDVYT